MFVDFMLGNLCLVCCLILFQPFMKLYLGSKYLLGYSTVLLLCVNIFLTIMLVIPSQIFIIYKLYQYDKYIILFSAAANIIISSLLANYIGVNGVLIGTLITSLIYLLSRVSIISNKIFSKSIGIYLKKILLYLCISAASICIAWLSTIGIRVVSWISLLCEGIMTGSICILVSTILSCKMEEAKYLLFHILPFSKKIYLLICGAAILLIGGLQIYLRYAPLP